MPRPTMQRTVHPRLRWYSLRCISTYLPPGPPARCAHARAQFPTHSSRVEEHIHQQQVVIPIEWRTGSGEGGMECLMCMQSNSAPLHSSHT